jgi:hypothetical protein
MRLAPYQKGALTPLQGYNIAEEDMTISLEEFSGRYSREDGEPECVAQHAPMQTQH